MNFIHIADVHFDAPFSNLDKKENGKIKRKLEQRNYLKKMIQYIKENKVEYLLIAGDLYENESVTEATIQYINQLFTSIPETKILIAPGNHDPYLKNSFYANYKWSNNVYIFHENAIFYSFPDADFYGFGFQDFYHEGMDWNAYQIKNPNKTNILIMHGDLNAILKKEKNYNPISENQIKKLGFDYVALGHIHMTNYKEDSSINYPGSFIMLGLDETGKHGMIYGEIKNHQLKTQYIELEKNKIENIKLDISDCLDLEMCIEKIKELKLENQSYQIILCGKRKFDINTKKIKEILSDQNIVKIKDETTTAYDIEKIKKENSLRGYFVQEILKHQEEYTIEEIQKAIDIGLENL